MWIYLIKCDEDSLYKVGKSKNPNKRVNQLQTGNPDKIRIVHQFKTENAGKVEKYFHNRYNHCKKEGEWFDLDLKEELDFINNCKKADYNFNYLKENKI